MVWFQIPTDSKPFGIRSSSGNLKCGWTDYTLSYMLGPWVNKLPFRFQVESQDKGALNKLVETVKTNFNERSEEIRKHWGGSSLGNKSLAKIAKFEKAKAKELASKQQ